VRKLRIYVALGIAVVWAVSYPVAVLTGNFSGFQAATSVMILAASFLLGSGLWGRNGDRR
jgi:hypothetical protein